MRSRFDDGFAWFLEYRFSLCRTAGLSIRVVLGHLFGSGDVSAGTEPAEPFTTYTGSVAPPQYLATDTVDFSELDSQDNSDTSSDDYQNQVDFADCQGYSADETYTYLYGQKRYANQRFARYSKAPVRRVRRFIRKRVYFMRRKGKGKGKGLNKGKGRPKLFFIDDISNEEWQEALTYLSSKGHNVYTSGKRIWT